MSFMRKLTQEFEGLKTSFSDDKSRSNNQYADAGYGNQYAQAQHPGGSYYPSEAAHPQRSDSGYSQGGNYASTPGSEYSRHEPPGQPPMASPSVPDGWVAQWNSQYQRWFYVDRSTGRSQWEHPAPPAPEGPPVGPRPGDEPASGDGTRSVGGPGSQASGYYGGSPAPGGYGQPGYGSPAPGVYGQPGYGSPAPGYGSPSPYGQPGYGQPGYGQSGYDQSRAYGGYQQSPYGHGNEQKKSNSDMLMGAAGGLAVGAVGGALVANAFNDSSDDEAQQQAQAAAAPPPAEYTQPPAEYYPPPAEYTQPPPEPAYDDAPPPVLGPTDADGNSVDSSDREDVADARQDYEEALAAAADSDAGSSEHEAVEEARENYEEAYEDVYGGEEEDDE